MDMMREFYSGQSMLFVMILSATLLLVVYGLIMVVSASSIDSIKANNGNPLAISAKQIVSALVGFAAMTFVSARSVEFFARNSFRIYVAATFLQVLVFLPGLGVSVNGNREWIRIPAIGYTIQPSEFIKLALIILLAVEFERLRDWVEYPKQYTGRAGALALVPMVLIMAGQDLGTTIIIAIIVMTMLFLSGVPKNLLMTVTTALSVAGTILIVTGKSRIGRFGAWLDPSTSDTANNYAWQAQHGIWALANAHIIGVGLGQSSLKWSWIPEVENDYIFAIIGEELGLIFAAGTIILFLLLGYWIVQVGLRSSTLFGRWASFGVATWIVVQAMVNIAVVLKALPVLGVPLPLISAGGSSLIAGMAAIGLVLSIERRNHLELDGGNFRAQRNRR
jgi:cell division protein FtsW